MRARVFSRRTRSSALSAQRGFTLIEVLVALAVLGAIASAAIALVGQNTRFAAAAETRMLARIVADNAMVEAASLGALELGASETEAAIAGDRFIVSRSISEPGVADLLRVDITVRRADGPQILAQATFLRPALALNTSATEPR